MEITIKNKDRSMTAYETFDLLKGLDYDHQGNFMEEECYYDNHLVKVRPSKRKIRFVISKKMEG